MDIKSEIALLESKLHNLSMPSESPEHVELKLLKAICARHGEFEQWQRFTLPGDVKRLAIKTECPVCLLERLEDLRKQRAADDAHIRELNIQRMMIALGTPARFADSTLDNYQPVNAEAERCLKVCKAYAAKWPERLKQGGGLVMCGKPGTGKNHLALAIARQVIHQYMSTVRFTTALKIARHFKSTWSKGSMVTEDDVIQEYTSPHLLIIDEVGVQFGSEAEKLIMFEIINTRYERMRPTILISNQTRKELAAFIGERVIDRMSDGGGCTLAFTWDSYRTRG